MILLNGIFWQIHIHITVLTDTSMTLEPSCSRSVIQAELLTSNPLDFNREKNSQAQPTFFSSGYN